MLQHRVILIIAGVIGTSFIPALAGSSWQLDGTLPSPVASHGVAVINGQILVFGGYDGSNVVSDVYLYQPGGGWNVTPANLPIPLVGMGFAEHQGRAYSIAGWSPNYDSPPNWGRTNEVWSYDPVLNTWDAKPSIGLQRNTNAAASLGAYVYTMGGHHEDTGHGFSLNLVDRYDGTGSWEVVAPMTQDDTAPGIGRQDPGAVVADGKIYAIGGFSEDRTGSNHNWGFGGWVEAYDPALNTWDDSFPPMPTPRIEFAIATLGRRIYTIGGRDANFNHTAVVEYLDLNDGQWYTDTPFPIATATLRAVTLNNAIYVLGGSTTSPGQPYLDTVYKLVATPSPSCTLSGNDAVAYWSFDDPNDPGRDDSGHGHNGALSGAIWDGYALWFDGVDDQITIPSAPDLEMSGATSVAAWIHPIATPPVRSFGTHSHILSKSNNNYYGGGINYELDFTRDPGTSGRGWFDYIAGTIGSCYTSETYAVGGWYHVVGVYDPTVAERRIYVNGVLSFSTSTVGQSPVVPNSAPLVIGYGSVAAHFFHFEGGIDEVYVFDRVLHDGEISALFLSQPGTPIDDCNSNGVADQCDIVNSTSLDENGNGIPDECENQAPSCASGGQYTAECAGSTTTVLLNGSLSNDPDPGDTLTFLWTTDCPGGSFNDPTSATPTLFVNTSPGCLVGCSVSLTVTDSHNASSGPCTAMVTIEDAAPPELAGVPMDVTVECDAVPTPAIVPATDQCDPSPVSNYSETTPPSATCSQESVIARTWTATDACGNATSATQVITVVDTTAPVFASVPADMVVECGMIPAPDKLSATDNCDQCLPTFFSEVQTGICDLTLTRTWEVSDACGNTASHVQMIVVEDITPPVATAGLTLLSSGDNEGGGDRDDDDEGIFVVVATCSDNCEGLGGCAAPAVSVVLSCSNGQSVAVSPGAVVEIEAEDEGDCEIEMEHGRLEIEGDITLIVTCTDASGNASTATAYPVGLAPDNDNEDEDDD